MRLRSMPGERIKQLVKTYWGFPGSASGSGKEA